MNRRRRSAFSLLEVMLATTVLLGSVIVLSHIAFVGTAHMDSAEQYAAAQLACQTRMNEMLSGALPIEEIRNQAIPELPGWGMTVKVESANQSGLLALQVTAAEQPAELATVETTGEVAGATQQASGAGKQFTLVRWILDPESSQSSSSDSDTTLSTSVDLPAEPSLFGDSMSPSESLLPDQTIPGGSEFLPEGPSLPEETSLFEEPVPEF